MFSVCGHLQWSRALLFCSHFFFQAKRSFDEKYDELTERLAGVTYTITNRDRSWTHPGNERGKEQHGYELPGFSTENLDRLERAAAQIGIKTQRHNLVKYLPESLQFAGKNAELLVFCGEAVDTILNKLGAAVELLFALMTLEFNEKNVSRGRKVQRHAQQSVVLTNDYEQEMQDDNPGDYVPLVHKMEKLPTLILLREAIADMSQRRDLVHGTCEINRYENLPDDPDLCGVGFHGDRESNLVWAVRIGNTNVPLSYQWYLQASPIGERFFLPEFENGSIYFMSAKAVGNDFLKSSQPTLRHAAGGPRFAPSIDEIIRKIAQRKEKREQKRALLKQIRKRTEQIKKRKQTTEDSEDTTDDTIDCSDN